MVRGLRNRRFTATVATLLWFAAVVFSAAPKDTNATCKAADHHCPEMPSVTCCCGGDTVVLTDFGARPVAKSSDLHVQRWPVMQSPLVDFTANGYAQARVSAVWSPLAAGPPVDRPVLHSALLL